MNLKDKELGYGNTVNLVDKALGYRNKVHLVTQHWATEIR